MKKEDIDCEYVGELTCPYCGNVNHDAWEIKSDDGGYEGNLGIQDWCCKPFIAQRHVSITYSSEKAPCLVGEAPHDWRPITGQPKEFYEGKQCCHTCGSKRKV